LNGPFSFDRTTFKAGNTMTERFAQITYEALPAEVRPLADDILKVSSAALGGPYNALLRSPEMARRAFDFLDYLRFKTSVNKRLNEFAILIQARISNAQYEWWAHEPIARKAGLFDAVMRDLQQCQRPASMQGDTRRHSWAIVSFAQAWRCGWPPWHLTPRLRTFPTAPSPW
jgi:hypothetical protein